LGFVFKISQLKIHTLDYSRLKIHCINTFLKVAHCLILTMNQIGELSGHSFRVGAALDLLDKNIPLEKIMLRGGWKSETSAMRYLQSWNDSNWLIIN